MPSEAARHELMSLLMTRVFEPVFKARSDEYRTDEDRRLLQHVKPIIEASQRRHEGSPTAEALKATFERELASESFRKIEPELRKLQLTTLEDVREEFVQACARLGV